MKLDKRIAYFLCTEACLALEKAGDHLKSITKVNDIKLKSDDGYGIRGGESLASQIVTEVDLELQRIILSVLKESMERYSYIGLLTEEEVDDKSRFEKDLFWCIDPLDGTLPFTEGKHGYSIAISLISKSGTPVVGAVYDPITDKCYFTYKTFGARINEGAWEVKNKNSGILNILIDRSFLDHELFKGERQQLKDLANSLGYQSFEVIQYGGSVMNAIRAAELGDACYFKFPKAGRGGGSIWDFGATACLYHELRLPVSDIYGDPLDLNRADDTFMNHNGVLYATRVEIAEAVQKLYRSYSNDMKV